MSDASAAGDAGAGVTDAGGPPAEGGADGGDAATPAPEVVEWFPTDGATEVPRAAAVRLTFSQAMDRAATELAFSMMSGGVAVAGTFSWTEGDKVLVFMPSAELTAGTSYMVTVGPEAAGQNGKSLATTFTIEFTTALEDVAVNAVWDDFLWDVDNWQ